MKKGDIVAKTRDYEKGHPLVRGMESMEKVREWIGSHCVKTYGKMIPYKVVGDLDNPGRFIAEASMGFSVKQEAKVNWVVANDASLTLWDGGMKIVDIDEENWEVIKESSPSFQSEVANMSEEELREELQRLRTERAVIKPPKAKGEKTPRAKADPMAKALANLSEDKKQALMKKLGMVD